MNDTKQIESTLNRLQAELKQVSHSDHFTIEESELLASKLLERIDVA